MTMEPRELALYDQALAGSEALLDKLIAGYKHCMEHEGGGELHATMDTYWDLVDMLNASQLATLAATAIRRLAK
jgi:hypothetical protein